MVGEGAPVGTMSRKGVIEAEKPQQCDLCGAIAELRPYGPKGEKICYKCGQKDPQTTERMMGRYLFG